MKKLLTILGPNGVGKSTTAKRFVELYENTAYIDAEWCRCMNPFVFTEETKSVVTENIYNLLYNYYFCNTIDTVIFTYGWHGERKQIYEKIKEKLKRSEVEFEEYIIILKCSENEIIRRALQDGRDKERIQRGLENTFLFYDDFDYPSIDTTNLTPYEVAKTIKTLIS